MENEFRIGSVHVDLHVGHFKRILFCFNEDPLGIWARRADFLLTGQHLDFGFLLRKTVL